MHSGCSGTPLVENLYRKNTLSFLLDHLSDHYWFTPDDCDMGLSQSREPLKIVDLLPEIIDIGWFFGTPVLRNDHIDYSTWWCLQYQRWSARLGLRARSVLPMVPLAWCRSWSYRTPRSAGRRDLRSDRVGGNRHRKQLVPMIGTSQFRGHFFDRWGCDNIHHPNSAVGSSATKSAKNIGQSTTWDLQLQSCSDCYFNLSPNSTS